MKLGVVFPQMEIGEHVDVIRDYARGVEDVGFDHLVAYDHVLGHRPADHETWKDVGPYTEAHQFHEVFVLFSFLAGITSKLEFATEVLILPQRQAVLVAKQAAELQLLSRGRLRLGIGVGWNPEEYRALGMDFHDRGKRVAEQVDVLRQLWAQNVITFRGQYHSIESAGIKPLPPPPTIPIWIGGSARIALRRAAAIADGFVLDHSLSEAPAVLTELKYFLNEGHRVLEEFGLAARVQLHPDDLGASVTEAADWKRLGITHLSLNTMNVGVSEGQHLRQAIAFMEAWNAAGFGSSK